MNPVNLRTTTVNPIIIAAPTRKTSHCLAKYDSKCILLLASSHNDILILLQISTEIRPVGSFVKDVACSYISHRKIKFDVIIFTLLNYVLDRNYRLVSLSQLKDPELRHSGKSRQNKNRSVISGSRNLCLEY